MSLILQQSNDEVSLAVALAKRSDIVSVGLRGANLSCGPASTLKRTLKPSLGFEPGPAVVSKQSFSIETNFWFRGIAEDPLQEPIIEITCTFESRYAITDLEFEPSAEQLEAFRQGNAVFNTWPFFREFVQSSVTRMGSPAPPVPFLRLVPKDNPAKTIEVAVQSTEDPTLLNAIPPAPAKKKLRPRSK